MVPTDCDLRGLSSMMLDLGLLTSDLAALSTGEEFKAAVLLYGATYEQVPAGSLPNDDRLLAFLSRTGTLWPQVRDMALRGWVQCSDGRLYHAVTADKVLHAWIGRLKQRVASGVGNETRWNTGFDRAAVEAQIATAMQYLFRVDPTSAELARWLKKNPGGIPSGNPGGSPSGTPGGTPKPVPPRSQVEVEAKGQNPSQEEGSNVVQLGSEARA